MLTSIMLLKSAQKSTRGLAQQLVETIRSQNPDFQPRATIIGAANYWKKILLPLLLLGPLGVILSLFFTKDHIYGAVITDTGVYIAGITLTYRISYISFIKFYEWSTIKITKVRNNLLNKQIVFEVTTSEGKTQKYILKWPYTIPKNTLKILKKYIQK